MPAQQMAASREAARAGRGCEAEGGRAARLASARAASVHMLIACPAGAYSAACALNAWNEQNSTWPPGNAAAVLHP